MDVFTAFSNFQFYVFDVLAVYIFFEAKNLGALNILFQNFPM